MLVEMLSLRDNVARLAFIHFISLQELAVHFVFDSPVEKSLFETGFGGTNEMKLGFCLSAFFVGCFMAVFMRANAPVEANANNSIARSSTVDSQQATTKTFQMSVSQQPYGTTKSGQAVTQFICENDNGYRLEMIDYGATISAFFAPDREGRLENITLGCSCIEAYEVCEAYFGSTVGRYANRIEDSSFTIDGFAYQLASNDGAHALHGGNVGFDKRIWSSEMVERDHEVGIRFTLFSEDGEEGYPGNLEVTVEYILTDDNELKISYFAESDKSTPVNLTNHAYWNLAGAMSGDISNHQLKLNADQYLSIDENAIPVEKADVANTPFDFRKGAKLGDRFDQTGLDPIGFDHCFVLKDRVDGQLKLAATVADPDSGRKMQVLTDQPGIQLYTGNYLNGQPVSGGYGKHQALCLETQAFPNAPNRNDFPCSMIRPGEQYTQTTIYRFKTDNN